MTRGAARSVAEQAAISPRFQLFRPRDADAGLPLAAGNGKISRL
jgi:hypothetical protein